MKWTVTWVSVIFLIGCTDPKTVFINGTIFDFRKEDQYSYALRVGRSGIWDDIRYINEDGRFKASLRFSGRNVFDSIYLLKKGQLINAYTVERNAMEQTSLKDTQNELFYKVSGSGPYEVENLVLGGKLRVEK